MTKEEAWKIIEECRGWNTGQRTGYEPEDAIYDARRLALEKAWETVGEAKIEEPK